MRRIFAFVILSVLTLTSVSAQSYDKLWQQVKVAGENDLPRDAITSLHAIEQKAEMEKMYCQLSQALFTELEYTRDSYPDSIASLVLRMEKCDSVIARYDRVLSILYRLGLHKRSNELKKYGLNDPYADYLDIKNPGGKSLVKEILADKSLSAAFTKSNSVDKYAPLVYKTEDSKVFNNDLISLVASTTSDFHPLLDYYQKKGNRPACCITASQIVRKALISSKNGPDSISAQLDSLIQTYADLKECGALAVDKYSRMYLQKKSVASIMSWVDSALVAWPDWKEMNQLKNFRDKALAPELNIVCKSTYNPSFEAKIFVMSRNISTVKFKVTPIENCPREVLSRDSIDEIRKYINDAKQICLEYKQKDIKYTDVLDSLSLGELPVGPYLVESHCDNPKIWDDSQILWNNNLTATYISLGSKEFCTVALNAVTGHPVQGAKIIVKSKGGRTLFEGVTDAKGEYICEGDSVYKGVVETSEGYKACELIYNSRLEAKKAKDDEEKVDHKIFTDRGIYRPGQTVHIAVLAYKVCDNNPSSVASKEKIELTLDDDNGNELVDTMLVTDSYGVARMDYTLPEHVLNGRFEIETDEDKYRFVVEEYVRPTFDITFDEPNFDYNIGDTVQVNGYAKMFSGGPVSNANVTYIVKSEDCWWLPNSANGDTRLIEDTLKTDASGHFVIRMPIVLPKEEYDQPYFYYFTADVKVTDLAGESHESRYRLVAGNRSSTIYARMKEKILSDTITNVTFRRVNMMGRVIPCKMQVYLDDKHIGDAENDKPFSLPEGIASGKHTLKAICERDTLENSLFVFSLNDQHPVTKTDDWWYVSRSNAYKSDDKPVDIQFGTIARDVYAMYVITSTDRKVVERGTLSLDSSLVHRQITYKKEYGDGICYSVFWVRNGKTYSHHKNIEFTSKKSELDLKWKTFRDRLSPGQKEEWCLYVTDKAGKPVPANVIATLYDLSLDRISDDNYDGYNFIDRWGRIRRYSAYIPYNEWTDVSGAITSASSRINSASYREEPRINFSRLNLVNGICASGYVLSYNSPIEGAKIYEYGNPDNSTVTDRKGRFSLPLKNSNQLVVSAQFYESRIVDAGVNMDIRLYRDYQYKYEETFKVIDKLGVDNMLQGQIAGIDLSWHPDVPNNQYYDFMYDKDIVTFGWQRKSDLTGSVQRVVVKLNQKEIPTAKVMRENLNETAFFYPQLRADGKGQVNIAFTVPESVTKWHLMTFAHDKKLNTGMLEGIAVTQKDLMIQPRVPRFLRSDDTCEIPASVSNLSKKDINAKATLTLLDAETEKEVFTYNKDVVIKAGETSAVTFPYDSKGQDDKMLIARFSVEGDGYSDGEQHYLPVLSAKEQILETRAMVIDKQGKTDIDIQKMMPGTVSDARLSVEYTDSPEWLLIQSMPSLVENYEHNSVSLLAALYVNTLCSALGKNNPQIWKTVREWNKDPEGQESMLNKNSELKQSILAETPWMMDAKSETEMKHRLYTLFDPASMKYRSELVKDMLGDCQHSDGGWSWWEDGSSSDYLTMAIVESLVRLNSMTGEDKDMHRELERGFEYLDNNVADRIKRMKMDKVQFNDRFTLNYLYCQTLNKGDKSDIAEDNIDYLLSLLSANHDYTNMDEKAMKAIILNANGRKSEARQLLESIRQHSVYTEDRGRYFDTERTGYCWYDYRIPTQTLVIEAFKMIEPEDTKTITEMQRWLLTCKRTQAWDTPIHAIDAIYAFFCPMKKDADGEQSVCTIREGTPADITLDNKPAKLMVYTSNLGYEKTSQIIDNSAKMVSIDKKSDGESWANVFVQYTQPLKDIDASSTGLHVERIINKVDIDGKAIVSADGSVSGAVPSDLKVGDKVRVTLTITADRDYDFVSVTDRRPACLEPVIQLSGYHDGCYQVMHDTQSQYHYDRMAKGTHVITTDYYVSRAGEFSSGTALVQCAYAPEFSARTKALTLSVTK